MAVRCVNHRAQSPSSSSSISQLATTRLDGCNITIQFGRHGVTLMDHVINCDNGFYHCDHCRIEISCRDGDYHDTICNMKPIACKICNILLPRKSYSGHVASSDHLVRNAIASQQTMINNLQQQVNTLHTLNDAAFIEFDIPHWSGIANGSSLYSIEQPLQIWGRHWWLKVDKVDDRIDVYLYCNNDDSTPIVIDYQLMVRHRAGSSVAQIRKYTAEFGVTRAWRLSNFASLQQLITVGGYRPPPFDDTITFGCHLTRTKKSVSSWGPSCQISVTCVHSPSSSSSSSSSPLLSSSLQVQPFTVAPSS
jgi:hypothetical protein